MLNLGDINFGLGVDTTALDKSMRELQKFSRYVNDAAGSTATALMRQEKAMISATNKVLDLNTAFRGMKNNQQYVDQNNAALQRYISTLSSAKSSTIDVARAQSIFNTELARTKRGFAEAAQSGGAAKALLLELGSMATVALGPLSGVGSRLLALGHIANTSGVGLAAFTAGAVAGAAALFAVGKGAFDAGVQFQKYYQVLKVVTGSHQGANEELNYAVEVAQRAGVSLKTVVDGYSQLSVAAKGTSLEGAQTKRIFEAIVLAGAKLQLSAADTEGSLRAVQQMMSKGTVQAEELRGQLGDRLPGAFNLAASAMGVSTAELGKMMKEGEVLSSDLLPKLAIEIEKTFGVEQGTKIDNITASFSRMATEVGLLFTALDSIVGISGTVKGAIDGITEAMKNYRTWAVGNKVILDPQDPSARAKSDARIGMASTEGAMKLFNTGIYSNPMSYVSAKARAAEQARLMANYHKEVAAYGTAVLSGNSIKSFDTPFIDATLPSTKSKKGSGSSTGKSRWSLPKAEMKDAQSDLDALIRTVERWGKVVDDSDDAIARMNDQASAYELGGNIDDLMKSFARNDAIADFKETLEDAGTPLDIITEKVDKFAKSFDRLDTIKTKMKPIQEAIKQMSATMEKSVDTFVDGMVDAFRKGELNFRTFANVLGNIATDIANTFIQLSISNPIKNWLFGGQNGNKNDPYPTLGSGGVLGGLGGLGGVLGGIFGGGGSQNGKQNSQAGFFEGEWDHVWGNRSGGMLGGILGGQAGGPLGGILGSVLGRVLPGILGGGGSGGGIFGGLGSIFGGIFGRQGLAFDSGVRKMRTGGILNSPTMFGTSSGMAVGGEAGTEAIMPLKKMSDGSLGVRTNGGGIVVNMTVVTQDANSFKKSEGQVAQSLQRAVARGTRNQ